MIDQDQVSLILTTTSVSPVIGSGNIVLVLDACLLNFIPPSPTGSLLLT